MIRTLIKQVHGIKNLDLTFRKMSESKFGLPLQSIVEKLNLYAATSLAESWDNVGLLIEPSEPKDITHILLTNDLTEDVMQEAVNLKTNMIISYHPPIFVGLKSVTNKTWKVYKR